MKKILLALATVVTCLTVNAEMLEMESFNRTIIPSQKYKAVPSRKHEKSARGIPGRYLCL